MGVTIHYLIQNALVFGKNKKKFAITQQSPRKYFYFGAFKMVSSKMNSKPLFLSYFQSKIFRDESGSDEKNGNWCESLGRGTPLPGCRIFLKLQTLKAALAFFYCAYYLRIFSSMFCGEITTNRRRLYRFRVFRIADLKTSQTKRFRGKFAKHGNKKNNSFRNIVSYNSANPGEMSGLK